MVRRAFHQRPRLAPGGHSRRPRASPRARAARRRRRFRGCIPSQCRQDGDASGSRPRAYGQADTRGGAARNRLFRRAGRTLGELLPMNATKRRRSLSDAEITAAYRRRDRRLAREPLATSVRYLPSRDAVLIEMDNRAALIIPRRLLQGLTDASPAQLRRGNVEGRGTAVSWPELDADFTIMSLLHGVYGGKRWMSELARRGGEAKSLAKARAARVNGAKGGRPRKTGARTRS